MPQMNPMNWLLLFLYFSAVFMLVIIKLHFMVINVDNSSSESSQKLLEVKNLTQLI